jgi:lysophospholipase L1-like esterase
MIRNLILPFTAILAINSASLFAQPAATAEKPVTEKPVAEKPVAKKHDAVTPAPKGGWWMKRHRGFNTRVAKGNVDLLMIGDSITHGWEGRGKKVWDEYYAKRNAVNLGIGGDRTQHVLWRLENGNIKDVKPKLAVIMIGTNNSRANSAEQIADGVEAIVNKLRTQLPEMKVLVLAIFPRGANDDDKLRQNNMAANKLIAKLADDKMIYFLDINSAFLTDDAKRTLSKEVMPDLLHPHAKGYGIWAEAMEPKLSELLGEKK